MKPEDVLKLTQRMAKDIRQMSSKSVSVGVLKQNASKRAYKSGASVLEVAATHEFGTRSVPQRSFLRLPQEIKEKELSSFIAKQCTTVLQGKQTPEAGLNKIGMFVRNLSIEAFKTEGFVQWPPLDEYTIKAKGSSVILTNDGILKQSITWEVRG